MRMNPKWFMIDAEIERKHNLRWKNIVKTVTQKDIEFQAASIKERYSSMIDVPAVCGAMPLDALVVGE
jgi:hypothetical protein